MLEVHKQAIEEWHWDPSRTTIRRGTKALSGNEPPEPRLLHHLWPETHYICLHNGRERNQAGMSLEANRKEGKHNCARPVAIKQPHQETWFHYVAPVTEPQTSD